MGKRLHFYTFLTYICLIICKRFMAFFLFFCIKKEFCVMVLSILSLFEAE